MAKALFMLTLLSVTAFAQAQPAIFAGADLALGARLLAESKCAECHARKVGGDGSAIYRPLERINAPGFCVAWWNSATPN